MNNVVKLPPSNLPSFDDLDREIEADHARAEALATADIDMDDWRNKARAVQGAMSGMEISVVTGAQFWAVFHQEPARSLFLEWARTCSAMLQDIVAEGDRITGRKP